MRTRLLGWLLAGLPLLASAAIYRWVDAHGQVHYGETPPRNAQYQEVNPAVTPPGGSDDLNGLREFVESNDKQAAEQRSQAQQTQQTQAQRAASCQKARDRLTFLDEHTARRLAKPNAEGGYDRYTDEDFDKARAQAQAAVEKNCGGATAAPSP